MSTILYSRQNMSCFQEFLEEPYVMDVKNFPKVFKFNYTSLTVTNYNGTSVELYLTNLNTVLNISLWSGVITVLMTVVLIFFLSLYCCLYHCTFGNKYNTCRQGPERKGNGAFNCCKAFTLLLVGFIILNSWAIVVLEVEVKKNTVLSMNGTENYIYLAFNSTDSTSKSSIVEVEKWKNYFFIARNYVYYYSLAYLNILVFVLLLLMPIAVLCAGRCKHATATLTSLLLAVLLLTWIGSLSASTDWGLLMYLFTLCYDLVQIGQGLNCDLYKLAIGKAERNVCEKYLLEPLFTLASYYSCLLVLLMVFQFFGIALCYCSARAYEMRVRKRHAAQENETQLSVDSTLQHFESAQTPGQQLTDDEPPRYEDVCGPGTAIHAL